MINTGRVSPVPARRSRRLLLIVSIGVFAFCCCGLPVTGAGAWFVHETVKASAGPKYPSIAALEFVDKAFSGLGDREALFTVVCDKREDEILSEADAYRAQLDAYARRWNIAYYRLSLGTSSTEEHGDRATYRSEVEMVWTDKTKPGEILGATLTITRTWTFEMVREGGLDPGWKVCRFHPARMEPGESSV
jgi:hypothetical protein